MEEEEDGAGEDVVPVEGNGNRGGGVGRQAQ